MLATAAAVAVAIVLGSMLTYLAVGSELRGEVDTSLRHQAALFATPPALVRLGERLSGGGQIGLSTGAAKGTVRVGPGPEPAPRGAPALSPAAGPVPIIPPKPGAKVPFATVLGQTPDVATGLALPNPAVALNGPNGYVQLVTPSGAALRPKSAATPLPVDRRVRKVAASGGPSYLRDAEVAGSHVRILTSAVPGGGAVEIARPLSEVDHVLGRMRIILLVLGLGGVALAATLGLLIARTTLAPVRRLMDATEHVASTRDLGRRIEATGSDELSRLAASFNAMLEALQRSVAAVDASVRAQRQLVADASHELRTPLTSLRTNIEVLEEGRELAEPKRAALLSDIHEQIEELTAVMNDVIELARDEQAPRETEPVRLDRLVEECLARARRNGRGVTVAATLEPCTIVGAPDRLARAINNLLDNAITWSPPGAEVEVSLEHGELRVRDHGPGIARADLPHVFDRFYRAAGARGLPGSGLGLAIVRQVAETHGGTVTAATVPDGGALLRLRLPVSAVEAEPQLA